MSITVSEKYGSPKVSKGENGSATRNYIIMGTTSEDDALNALASGSPAIYYYMPRKNFGVRAIANDIWEGTARYGADAPDVSSGQFTTSFDTSGGTVHVTQSRVNKGNYAPTGKTAPDFKGAIGVTKSEVQGVDITVPAFSFSETHYIANADSKALVYRDLTGCVNAQAFRGFADGEVLLMGVIGELDTDTGMYRVQFKFTAGDNVVDLNVGDINVNSKRAHEYMWVRYEQAEDTTAKTLVQHPASIHVEEVYPAGDFSLLGIGV